MRAARCLAALSLTVIAACGPGKAGASPDPLAGDTVTAESDAVANGDAGLSVDNQSIWDVRVYLVRGGQFVRLGMARSGDVTSFRMATQYVNRDLTFYFEAIGAAARLRTETAYVTSGQTVTVNLEKRLRSYSLAVH